MVWNMCADPTEEVGALIRRLGDADVLVQEDAVCRLASLGRDRGEALLLATVECSGTPPLVQENSMRILRLFQLVRALGHVRGSTRERAVAELSALGTPAWIILLQAERSPDAVVRANARRALHLMGRSSEPAAEPGPGA